MPSRKSRNDLVLFSSSDPQPLVNYLCETFGLSTVLESVARFQPTSSIAEAPAKRAYKKRGAKKGTAKKTGTKKGGKKRVRRTKQQMEADAAKGQ
jgi:hypothetical protein